ncbi:MULTISPECIES: hypothetical protein [unclassified Acinetobacter]|uniref:hypothetical protein n=1 Tax=unclassified Acinetobacter TaxID=196816 RepID=UPI0029348000|nr:MULTISPECIES: hypothetical protein [unclassified Acinetobacter]WOE32367.1 hypothetical protein QSG84_03925 [Acinetobacter sp. SAAs470]WOE37840.1 hypothetical protein QSG86_12975 [Acinetobacter sp. SAAs474]
MRKLKFVAKSEIKNQYHTPDDVQQYIAHLLTEQLCQQGFATLAQSGAQVAVSVDERALPLSITCEARSEDGHMVCQIASYPAEDQDWLERITEQSLLNQLAQAVENTLKKNQALSEFEWSSV